MYCDLKDTQLNQSYKTKKHVDLDAPVLFTEDKNMDKDEKKKKMTELSNALSALGVKPSTFQAYHIAGKTEKVKELLETALKERTKDMMVARGIPPRMEIFDPETGGIGRKQKAKKNAYNPHINLDADAPTVHEAFQYLMKNFVEDINVRNQARKKFRKAGMMAMAIARKTSSEKSNDKKSAESDDDDESLQRTKKILTSNGIVDVDSVQETNPELAETDAKIRELQKLLEEKKNKMKGKDLEDEWDNLGSSNKLRLSASGIFDKLKHLEITDDDPFEAPGGSSMKRSSSGLINVSSKKTTKKQRHKTGNKDKENHVDGSLGTGSALNTPTENRSRQGSLCVPREDRKSNSNSNSGTPKTPRKNKQDGTTLKKPKSTFNLAVPTHDEDEDGVEPLIMYSAKMANFSNNAIKKSTSGNNIRAKKELKRRATTFDLLSKHRH